MGTRQGNKPSSKKSHAAEDSISADSLSFAGLVSIQDQNSKPPIPNHTTHYYKVSKQDLDFEFSTIQEHLNSGSNPFKITPGWVAWHFLHGDRKDLNTLWPNQVLVTLLLLSLLLWILALTRCSSYFLACCTFDILLLLAWSIASNDLKEMPSHSARCR